jgi:hypothetical protein
MLREFIQDGRGLLHQNRGFLAMPRIYDLDRMGVLLFDFHMANSSRTWLYRQMSDFCRRFHLAARCRQAGIVLPKKV